MTTENSDQSDERSGLLGSLRLDSFKQAADVLGTFAASSTVLGAIAFGVGYLAQKQHDAMLGLISTTSYALYVRTGIEFVPRSLHAIGIFLSDNAHTALGIAGILIAGVVVVFVAPILLRRSQRSHGGAPDAGGTGETIAALAALQPFESALLALLSVGVLVLWVSRLQVHLAPLHAINTNLLLSSWHDDYTRQFGEAGKVYSLLHSSDSDAVLAAKASAKPISAWIAADQQLLLRYGKASAFVALFIYVLIMLRHWRARISKREKVTQAVEKLLLSVQDFAITPILLAVAVLLVLTLPSLYGVLAISNTLPCVTLISAKDTLGVKDRTRALSDLSADTKEVVLFTWGKESGERYRLQRVKADSVDKVIGWSCEANLLAEKRTIGNIKPIVGPMAPSEQERAKQKPSRDTSRTRETPHRSSK